MQHQCAHHQQLNEQPLRVWIAVKENGSILTARCNCMDGLGEVCCHVAATLFSVSKGIEMLETTCISRPCEWVKPTAGKGITYTESSENDFTTLLKNLKLLVRKGNFRIPP